MCIKHHIITINKTHSNKLNKNNPTHIRIIAYLKSPQQLKNQENKGSKHEELKENKKTHTFFLKIEVEMMKNNGGFGERT